MTEHKTSEAQIKASRNWEKKNPERTRYLTSRRAARSFIRNYAKEEDIEELRSLISEIEKISLIMTMIGTVASILSLIITIKDKKRG